MKPRWVTFVIALLLADCAHNAPPPAAGIAVAHSGIAPLAPVLLPQRSAPWTPSQLADLHARLETALAPSALATSGIVILDADGRPLFMRRATQPMAPASTFKLLVATTALNVLGPDYRFVTRLEALDVPQAGAIDGDLYLVGDGDPSLSSDQLNAGVGTVVRAGVQTITGGIIADATAFGGREINPAWDPDDLQYDYAAGTSALTLDDGTVTFDVDATSSGAPARIVVHPPSAAVRVEGAVLTGGSTDLSIERAADRNVFTFSGDVELGAEPSFVRPVIDQPLYVAGVVRSLLTQRGIVVAGPDADGIAPLAGAVLWEHRSTPLRSLLRDMLFPSDNHYAEQLLRAIAAYGGAVGTESSGASVERAVLRRLGVPDGGLRVVDGSGLAPVDRITALTIATLLSREAEQPTGEVLYDDLPRVGMEGTVRNRDVTTALGRARAKSGHISDVNALAGYVQTAKHGRVAFSIIVNDPRADDGLVDGGIDAALDILAGS